MAGTVFHETAPLVVEASALIGVDRQPVELTRGSDEILLERLEPLVRGEDVELDLSLVERIDAAGLAALITLYSDACKAGHRFTISSPVRHVHEVLSIVGLASILIPAEGEPPVAMRPHVEQHAA